MEEQTQTGQYTFQMQIMPGHNTSMNANRPAAQKNPCFLSSLTKGLQV